MNVIPKLTVAIPVYNTNIDLVERAINSVPKESFIVLIDDCSDKYNLSESLNKERYNHVGIIRLSKNIGLGAVRNFVINECKSEWIMFLDSDDTLNTELVSNCIKSHINDPRFDIICGDINLITDDKIIAQKVEFPEVSRIIPYFTTSNIYRTNYLRSNNIYYDESRKVYEDIPFSIKLWTDLYYKSYNNKMSLRALKINYPLYNYYLQGNSLTRTDKDKYLVLSDTLRYWIDWIVDYFNSLKYPRFFKDSIKTYIINRIKYEATKSLELKLKYDHSNDDYSLYFDRLKTYKLNNLLN